MFVFKSVVISSGIAVQTIQTLVSVSSSWLLGLFDMKLVAFCYLLYFQM